MISVFKHGFFFSQVKCYNLIIICLSGMGFFFGCNLKEWFCCVIADTVFLSSN